MLDGQNQIQKENRVSQTKGIAILLFILCFKVVFSHFVHNGEKKRTYAPPMTSTQSMAWSKDYLQPVLLKAKNDRTPEVRVIINKLFKLLNSKEIGLSSPPTSDYNIFAFISWEKKYSKLIIEYPAPIWKKLHEECTSQEFEDTLLMITCHETIHLLYDPKKLFDVTTSNYQDYVDNECEAWAITVRQVVRPMMRDNRYVEEAGIIANAYFTQCKGNSKSHIWRKFISENLVIPKEDWNKGKD